MSGINNANINIYGQDFPSSHLKIFFQDKCLAVDLGNVQKVSKLKPRVV